MRPGRPGNLSGIMAGFAAIFAIGALGAHRWLLAAICLVAAVGLVLWEARLNRADR